MQNTENDNGTSPAASLALIAGAVGGLMLLVGMIVVARKPNWLRRAAQGQLDILKSAMKSNIFADPAQYTRFCRSVSFHGLRYNEEFMSISNTNLMLVYDLLLLERPEVSDLASLRFICARFLRKDVSRDPSQYIERSVGFVEESLIDVVLEELLDIYVQADRVAAQYSEAGRSEYAALSDPLHKEATPLSLYDHLTGSDRPGVPYNHFYEAINEYLVGKRCVKPGTYVVPGDKNPIYSELMLLTGFNRGGNRPRTSIIDTEYSVIDAEYSVIKTPDGDYRSDSGSSYQVASNRSSAIYEVASVNVNETATSGGGGEVYENPSLRPSNVYNNMSGPGAEGRSSILYETAGAMGADRLGITTVYEVGTAINIQDDAAATGAEENWMSPIYKVVKKFFKKTPKRLGLAPGEIGNRGRIQEPFYDLTDQLPMPPRLDTPPTGTPHTQNTAPKQRTGRSQFAVGVPVTQRSSIFLLAGKDMQVSDQVNDNTIGDDTLILDVSACNTKPSNNGQLIADITNGELPAYEEPVYLIPEELAAVAMPRIKAEAHFGSRDNAVISAVNDTVAISPDQSTVEVQQDAGVEPDFSGKRSLIICGSSSWPCFLAPVLFSDPDFHLQGPHLHLVLCPTLSPSCQTQTWP